MLAHLRAGGAMLILVDQRLARGDALPFLGVPAMTPTAVAAMAARLGAPLIPARAVRDSTGLGFDVRFEPAIPADAPVAMMAAVNARLGAWIDETPGQWFWLHRRWRPTRRRRRAA
jgi:KDO2-lipid IV(A) lauroyltransferase